jgi:hypothetical protein
MGRARVGRVVDPELAAHPEVDDAVDAARGAYDEVLAVPVDPLDPRADEDREPLGRVAAHGARPGDGDPVHPLTDELAGEPTPNGLDLGKLGHL